MLDRLVHPHRHLLVAVVAHIVLVLVHAPVPVLARVAEELAVQRRIFIIQTLSLSSWN